MNRSKQLPWILAGFTLLAMGCQESVTGSANSDVEQKSSGTNQSSSSSHDLSSSSIKDTSLGTCTPIYIITPADLPNELVDFNDGIEYCEETIRANKCAGNFCLTDENIYRTVDQNFKLTTPYSSSSGQDTTQGACTPIYRCRIHRNKRRVPIAS